MLQVFLEHSGEAVILRCSGRMVAGDDLAGLYRTATMHPAASMVIDLGGVESVDAAGLGTLLRIRQWCESRDMNLKLISANRQVHEVLALTALDSVLELQITERDFQSLVRQWACAET